MNPANQLCSRALEEFYRAAPESLPLWEMAKLQNGPGFFQFGPKILCFGHSSSGTSPEWGSAGQFDASRATQITQSGVYLPFDFDSVIDNLRTERYALQLPNIGNRFLEFQAVRKLYYALRKFLPVGIRRQFQKIYFKDWQKLPFPHWPVDFTADLLHEEFLKLLMKAQGVSRLPFIWFWPEGANACALVTHDVETAEGRDFSSTLMDIDAAHGFRASFQVVPETRYDVPESYWREIRSRGFEFNVHDLNHDGYLFQERAEFERRARLINSYAKKYGSHGFRAGAMYRNLEWYDAFEFSYDMSAPNVAHLEPQRGGCCTVMPFFVGKILEIPLTTSQDYAIFNVLEDYSIELWKKQIELILERNGLISILTHPDYLIDAKPRKVYESLLVYLRQVCDSNHVWHALPGELDQWWRARSQMRLSSSNGGWQILGPESQRARLAYATVVGDRLTYCVSES